MNTPPKRGRPPKPKNELKDITAKIPLTRDQYEFLCSLARAVDLDFATWAMDRLMAQATKESETL